MIKSQLLIQLNYLFCSTIQPILTDFDFSLQISIKYGFRGRFVIRCLALLSVSVKL